MKESSVWDEVGDVIFKPDVQSESVGVVVQKIPELSDGIVTTGQNRTHTF